VNVVLSQLMRLEMEKLTTEPKRLLTYLQKLVDHQVECANDPERQKYRTKSFSSAKYRRPSKKWETRKIFFEQELH